MITSQPDRRVLVMTLGLVALVVGAIAFSGGHRSNHSAVGPLTTPTRQESRSTTVAVPATTVAVPAVTTSPGQTPATPVAVAQAAADPAVNLPTGPSGVTWKVLASTASGPAVWGAAVHPLSQQPNVIASYALFDPSRVHAALFNGTDLPGGGPWTNGSRVTAAAQPALLAAFNGGFRFKHIKGGYYTESRTVKPLINGDATLGIRSDGRMVLGVYGRDLTNDGTWVSLRQNLPPVIDGGKNVVGSATELGSSAIYWGDDYGGVLLDRRSAICRRADGLLMYVVTEKVTIEGLAKVLLAAQCDFAMELDINGSWPQFVSFAQSAAGPPTPTALAPAMSNPTRVLTGSTKDFIALFDPARLPADVVK